MVLVFLILFAWIAFSILSEIEREEQAPKPATGCCPGCEGAVESGWLLCPRCRTLLMAGCGCGRQIDNWRAFCPWCGRGKEEVS